MNNALHVFQRSQWRPLRRILFLVAVVAFALILVYNRLSTEELSVIPPDVVPHSKFSKTLIVSTQKGDTIEWMEEHLSDWNHVRYVVDDPSARYTVPKNKGREAMVYLTYMIDHYDSLPDLMVFIHNGRYQWHNDDPIYDGVPMLRSLQIPYLLTEGYTNIRCVWTLGCPAELKDLDKTARTPIDPSDERSARQTESQYAPAFIELFPGRPVPSTVGVACCAQFALTRAKVRERPLEDYIRYRKWLLETPLVDSVSGRVLEYSWHIVFGKEAVHCPNAGTCYCNVFGLCELVCTEGKCGERWKYPRYATLPTGWPEVGWDKEVRDKEFLEKMRWVGMRNGTTEVS